MIKAENTIFSRLEQLIDQNLDQTNLNQDFICREIGVSRAHLHRLLKQQSNLSITHFVRKIRLEKAKYLLQESELRIAEIADAVGINSPQNFSKYFIQEYHLSPTEFRKTVPEIKDNEQISLAVLPFVNISNNPDQEYFSDGITEEIINVLSHASDLKVVGRSSSFVFKGKNEDIRNIGNLLNVKYILEGSVRKSDTKLRITAQLIQASDGFQVWSEKYDRELVDVFDIQDEISLTILKEIKLKLLGQDKALKRYTNNPEAYQLYLHGRFYHNKFAGPEEFYKSISFFKKAIEIEPEYALAYSGIASCYLNLWFYRYLKPEISLVAMKNATQKAIEIDDEIPESYLALARMQLLYEWDLNAASVSFKKALQLGGNSAELHSQYALLCGIKEEHELAKIHAEMALSIDPFSLFNNFYSAYIYWLAGNFEEAISQGKKMLDLEPDFWGGYVIIGLNMLQTKNYDEALASLELALKYNLSGFTLSACGVLYGLSNQKNKALKVLKQMLELSKSQPISAYDMGIVYASIGDFETACNYFETAITNHEPSMLFFKFIVRDWIPDFKNDQRCLSIINKIYNSSSASFLQNETID